MQNNGDFPITPITVDLDMNPPGSCAGANSLRHPPVGGTDIRLPLQNLSAVRARMDSVQKFLSDSLKADSLIGKDQMHMVSAEISSAIHHIIVNGAAILSFSQSPNLSSPTPSLPEFGPQPTEFANPTAEDLSESMRIEESEVVDLKEEKIEEEEIVRDDDEWDIIELDSVQLLAEHVHFCDICGKGFKRDANLRMHMRAHGDQFKTPEALSKPTAAPEEESSRTRRVTRFSCPFAGCNRNRSHKKFRPLKSVICVKNHFKRTHCPKMYSCNRCNKKSFSVLGDLKSHLRHCGEVKWKCSCGTSFSRKDKLFGHMALFEGHMPAVLVGEDGKGKGLSAAMEEDEEDEGIQMVKGTEMGVNCSDDEFFGGLFEGFDSIENYGLQDILLASPDSCLNSGINAFYNF